jgi:hypothetical protein
MAVEEQSVQLLRVALKWCHPCPGEHSLHEAARQANVPALRLLLQNKADPNARCRWMERGCERPLQIVTSCPKFFGCPGRSEAVELLLRAGASPTSARSDAEANTPLHDAVLRNDLEVVSLLLQFAADPNAVNASYETPLGYAIRLGSAVADFVSTEPPVAIVEALLRGGASPFTVDVRGSIFHDAQADQELHKLFDQWSAWWRCRVLAWIRSRGSGHPLCDLPTDLFVRVSGFL